MKFDQFMNYCYFCCCCYCCRSCYQIDNFTTNDDPKYLNVLLSCIRKITTLREKLMFIILFMLSYETQKYMFSKINFRF